MTPAGIEDVYVCKMGGVGGKGWGREERCNGSECKSRGEGGRHLFLGGELVMVSDRVLENPQYIERGARCV